jgi:uncharacterized protein (DUF952 family)
MAEPVYKVLTEAAFRDAERDGHFRGSADDLRDDFIHLYAALDLAEVLWAETLPLAADGFHVLPEGVSA